MHNLKDMIWIEARKALRSRMPWGTALGALFLPFALAFLIFVARNPEVSQKLGLMGAKANLVAYSATDWPAYLVLIGMFAAAGGFFLFVLVISWIFGREFTDGTLKDMLAVPVQRASILLAKFCVAVAWSAVLVVVILVVGMLMGAVIQLPGGSPAVLAKGAGQVAITMLMEIVVVLPFGFLASLGRGYLLSIGLAMLAVLMANLEALTGFGEFFPWAIPALFVQGKTPLAPVSYWIVVLTGLAGLLATYLWWKYADQNR